MPINPTSPTGTADKHWMNNPWDAQRRCFVDPGYTTPRLIERVGQEIVIHQLKVIATERELQPAIEGRIGLRNSRCHSSHKENRPYPARPADTI